MSDFYAQFPSALFPHDFKWGVATASYQIEGAHDVDGRGESNWDVFCRRPGAIFEGHTGNTACEHYFRLEEDLQLLQRLGVDSYRFSVSWSRVLPEGTGQPNEKGLAFYERLIDGLLARDITPFLTLFHWDAPQQLEQRGGFRNPESPRWFAEFTELLARRFGDRVKNWLTINEPHAFVEGGLRHGRHAPGVRLPLSEVLLAGHHALLAHGLATQVLRANVAKSWVAMAPVLICATPASSSERDIEAARQYTFSMRGTDLRSTSWWMDPAFGRGYPEDGLRNVGADMPKVRAAEMDLIHQPLDAVGFNLYDAAVVSADPQGKPMLEPPQVGQKRSAFNWPITPEAHFYGPKFAHERYGLPILITENGLSCRHFVHRDGRVVDSQRVDFIHDHLRALGRASKAGIPIVGYFHWSLLDNFEWNHGYRERFGLVHVDYATMKRTPKESYFYYRDLIAAHQNGR